MPFWVSCSRRFKSLLRPTAFCLRTWVNCKRTWVSKRRNRRCSHLTADPTGLLKIGHAFSDPRNCFSATFRDLTSSQIPGPTACSTILVSRTLRRRFQVGSSSNLLVLGITGNHFSRRFVQTSISGTRSVGTLSSDPKRISTSSSFRQNKRPPHRGQKLRPAYVEISPEYVNVSRGQWANEENEDPLSFRQSAQWQSPMRKGSPST
jgi:hypothetical protein